MRKKSASLISTKHSVQCTDTVCIIAQVLYIFAQGLYIIAQILYGILQELYIIAQELYIIAQILYNIAQILYIIAQELCIYYCTKMRPKQAGLASLPLQVFNPSKLASALLPCTSTSRWPLLPALF